MIWLPFKTNCWWHFMDTIKNNCDQVSNPTVILFTGFDAIKRLTSKWWWQNERIMRLLIKIVNLWYQLEYNYRGTNKYTLHICIRTRNSLSLGLWTSALHFNRLWSIAHPPFNDVYTKHFQLDWNDYYEPKRNTLSFIRSQKCMMTTATM